MSDLEFILEKIGPGDSVEDYALWACRGKNKGCRKHQKKKKHCPDCVACDNMDETLAELQQRIARGDA